MLIFVLFHTLIPLQALFDSCEVLQLKIQDIVNHSFLNYKLVNQYKLEFKCETCNAEDIVPIRGLQNFFS